MLTDHLVPSECDLLLRARNAASLESHRWSTNTEQGAVATCFNVNLKRLSDKRQASRQDEAGRYRSLFRISRPTVLTAGIRVGAEVSSGTAVMPELEVGLAKLSEARARRSR